ncbi:SRPBCC family protein [Paraglaciecola sp. MB-3u-78]|jgi:Rieske 2Fe-2S family protein|uniref:aromatic ring-hydroxylating oxygenase subunit alpha n=1 Tax=Paraglaciecola sp. MB-3u-78 TaxID=2058332 RepID=UPI000C322BD2|nr:aromatic ring-hydroxylating dioxygenase subunit alpha [Paraglaciecola sp. MB-3u-78]PKG98875.1 Rieske (2Fe-2S) protein [Paraglaciecola sp. MB-3u-78]
MTDRHIKLDSLLPVSCSEQVSEYLNSHPVGFSLPRKFYTDQHYFDLEMEQIFQKEWLFVGLTCEIPAKGNFITLQIGSSPITIVRGDQGQIRAFHNVCRHRGSKLCLAKQGKVAKLVCSYHQWTYELDGNLLYAGTNMGSDFDKSKFSLHPINCRTAGGYMYVSLSDNPTNIDAYFDDLQRYLEPYDLDNAKVAVQSTIVEEANWKLVIENNRECYHCDGSHPELLTSLLEWDDTEDPRASDEFRALVASKQAIWEAEGIPYKHVSHGHGLRNRIVRMPLKDGTVAMTQDGRAACSKLMGRIKNPDLGSMRILHLPNSWCHAQGDHIVVFEVRPLGPQLTEVITKWVVNKEAVEGVDYNIDRLTYVWNATNSQDRNLVENNQRGVNSIAYQPGPYSETYEFGVINFIDWFSHSMQKNIAANGPQ